MTSKLEACCILIAVVYWCLKVCPVRSLYAVSGGVDPFILKTNVGEKIGGGKAKQEKEK